MSILSVREDAIYDFERALLSMDRLAAAKVLEAWSSTKSPMQLVEELVAPALERIGTAWEEGRVALSQVYLSGRICEELVDTILPPADPARRSQPKIAICVLEDHHVLGKRIVYSALRASGFEVLDFGHGLTVQGLVDRVIKEQVKVLLISVLMLPSALLVGEVSAKLKAAGADVRIVVGGAPFRFDEQLWKEVGADAMARNSGEASSIVARILEDLA